MHEIEGAGLLSLLGERVLLLCANYFYEGVFEGFDENLGTIMLTDAGIVYETGPWTEDSWKDRQALEGEHYVQIQSLESFRKSPPLVSP